MGKTGEKGEVRIKREYNGRMKKRVRGKKEKK